MRVEDPNWPRASQWLGGSQRARGDRSLAVMGVPMNSSITPGHCDLAPAAIRKALERYSLYDPEREIDLDHVRVADGGDFDFANQSAEQAFAPTVQFIAQAAANATCAVLLGGDNGITRPGLHAMGLDLRECGLLTFDAHHDLRDLEGGLTAGNPIRALLRDGLPGANVVQVGIQAFTNSSVYAQVAREAGITVVTADQVYARGIDAVVQEALEYLASKGKAIYVDLDVDVLDRAFAPASPGSRPGGLQPWMLRRAAKLCGRHQSVRMMDIVEVDPTKDVADVTCLAAAAFLLAFASGVAGR
ncbi:MAG: arginase family protein [Chthoniobacterales bacterium]